MPWIVDTDILIEGEHGHAAFVPWLADPSIGLPVFRKDSPAVSSDLRFYSLGSE